MLASKVAQALSISSRAPLTLPALHARALFATKKVDAQDKSTVQKVKEAVVDKVKSVVGAADKKGTPAGEQGRDVRDMGTGKVNVPVGQPTKKADAPESKFGGKAPGMAGSDQRGHDEVSGGLKTSTGKASAQQPGSATNYQPKRSFSISATIFAKDSGRDSSKDQQSKNQNTSSSGKDSKQSQGKDHDAKNTFVSESAKKNMNPDAQSSAGSFKNKPEFYPEKPGFSFDPRSQQDDGQDQGQKGSSQKGGQSYGAQHNPSKTGKQQDSKYMDEALAGKSGPLVGGDEGKRKFSTSAAAWAAAPKEPKDSGKDEWMSEAMSRNRGNPVDRSGKRDGSAVEGGFINPDAVKKARGTDTEGDDASETVNRDTTSGGMGGRPHDPSRRD